MIKDLKEMTLDELKSLQIKVKQEIESFEQLKRKEALDAIKEIEKQYGYKAQDLLASISEPKAKSKVAPKFAHPENPEITWSGRGRKPNWINQHLEAGKPIDELFIK